MRVNTHLSHSVNKHINALRVSDESADCGCGVVWCGAWSLWSVGTSTHTGAGRLVLFYIRDITSILTTLTHYDLRYARDVTSY